MIAKIRKVLKIAKKQLLTYNEELQKYKHLALGHGRCGLEYFFSANIQNKNEKG